MDKEQPKVCPSMYRRLAKARKENYWIIADTQEPDGERDE